MKKVNISFIFFLYLVSPIFAGNIIKVKPNFKKLDSIKKEVFFTNIIGQIEKINPIVTESNLVNWKTDNGKSVCEIPIKIEKPNNKTYGIIVYFKKLILPKGSSIYAYSSNKKSITQKFFSNNNKLNKTFALPIVYGNKVIVKVELNTINKNNFQMEIDKIGITADEPEGFGAVDDCYFNVNCNEAKDWQDQKRSVLKYVYIDNGEIGKCTGALINNTLNDRKNLFLSAQHCGISATDEELGQTIFYFNYESKDCNNPLNDNNLNKQTVIGCKRIAASGPVHTSNQDFPDGSDFVLFEINPIPKEYNVSYAGWNRNDIGDNIKGIGAIIQHPLADIKKISFWDSFKASGTSSFDFEAHCITVNGKGGTVEPMSSGSPVFDKNKRIVGTISYGSQGCVEGQEHPSVNGGTFFSHWNQNGTEKYRQLTPWLDPNNSGVMVLDGKNTVTSVETIKEVNRNAFFLSQNHPNPFNPTTQIKYQLSKGGIVKLTVYNLLGQKVAVLINEYKPNGKYSVLFDANNLPSGVYIYKLQVNNFISVKKMLLTK